MRHQVIKLIIPSLRLNERENSDWYKLHRDHPVNDCESKKSDINDEEKISSDDCESEAIKEETVLAEEDLGVKTGKIIAIIGPGENQCSYNFYGDTFDELEPFSGLSLKDKSENTEFENGLLNQEKKNFVYWGILGWPTKW